MQKLARRAAQAQRQAQKKAIRTVKREKLVEKHENIREESQRMRAINSSLRKNRQNRRDDWLRGPLATQRDVGDKAEIYGTVDPTFINLPKVRKPKDFGIVKGDRVVVATKGHPLEGKISKVEDVDIERESCLLELYKADIVMPKYILAADPNQPQIQARPIALNLSQVRLVANLQGRDVVINELDVKWPSMRDGKPDRSGQMERSISGLVPQTQIPLPEKEEETHTDEPMDTLRIDVDKITFTPTLHQPPMPPSVIDELRNKYSKFRTRHDPEFLERVEGVERRTKEREALMKLKMLSPLQEKLLKQKAWREQRPQPELSEDMLARIGEVMDQQQRRVAQ